MSALQPSNDHSRLQLTFLLLALLCLPTSVSAQVDTYKKSVKSYIVNGQRLHVGMTHDEAVQTLRRTRATASDQKVVQDPRLDGSLLVQRYYSTPEGIKFLVEFRRVDLAAPYRVVRIALPEARR